MEVDIWSETQPGPGRGVHGKCEVLTSDLQAGLTLPSAILINGFASVEASIAALSGQDPKPTQSTLCLLRKAPLVGTHGLAVSQPVGGARTQAQGPGSSPEHAGKWGYRAKQASPPPTSPVPSPDLPY